MRSIVTSDMIVEAGIIEASATATHRHYIPLLYETTQRERQLTNAIEGATKGRRMDDPRSQER